MSTIVEEENSATYLDEQRLHTLSGDNVQFPAAAGHTVERMAARTQISGDLQRRVNFTTSVIADFDSTQPYCYTCKSAQHLSPALPAVPIIFACINAAVGCPQFLCG